MSEIFSRYRFRKKNLNCGLIIKKANLELHNPEADVIKKEKKKNSKGACVCVRMYVCVSARARAYNME